MQTPADHEFRIVIHGAELFLVRNTINPDLHSMISRDLEAGKKILYQYTRFDFHILTLPGNTASYESPSIFSTQYCPPTIVMFAQLQKRHMGDLAKSPFKFEIPGGKTKDGIPRLTKLEIRLAGIQDQA